MAGCEGPAGPAGANGVDGNNGADGTNGTDGNNGNNGTDGNNGTNGTDGVDGVDGVDYVNSKLFKNIDLAITQVSNDGGALAITFTAWDNGNPITNLTMAPIRIYFNQYMPAANAYDNAVWSVDRFYERGSTTDADLRFVQGPLGTYTYTFLETIAEGVANDGVDTALVTQAALRIRGFETYNSINAIYQMTGIPTTDGAVATEVAAPVGEIVLTSACESCHGPRIGNVGHGGGYNRTEFCRNCHTQDDPAFVTDGVDFRTMIHQIHSAIDHTNGGVDPGFDWTEVTYPQDPRNCDKCHQGADGQNWNLLPTREACGGCHNTIDFDLPFATGGHMGGVQTTNANCQNCHDTAAIKGYHANENATTYNPDVPAGAANFAYAISSMTVDAAGTASVVFQISKDGAPIADLKTTYPPAGFTGGPSFIFAYALPQDGVTTMVDWNNLGRASAQPASVTVASLIAAATFDAGTNAYTATVANAFPVGSTMRTVSLQGYFTQTSLTLARHTTSVVKVATGDAKRRAVIQSSGCVDCHEIFEGHGGNRVFSATTVDTDPIVCTLCHVPNLSSSGRTWNMATYTPGSNANTDATIALFGNDPMLWPEDTNNFKDLIHGIHSSDVRENPYEFVRIRSGAAYGFDFAEVRFPGDPSNCSKCHKGTSYSPSAIPAGALWSNKTTDNGAIVTYADVTAARGTVPNAQDQVLAPVVAACNGCHNGALINAHMESNGANFGMTRGMMGGASPAQCTICHDSGSLADVQEVHAGLNP